GAGARVVGAARGQATLDLPKEVAADVVVDYGEPGWAERVREATGGGPDLVFDGVGGTIGRQAFEVTARGGRFSVHGASSGAATAIDDAEARRRGVTVIGIEQLFGFQAVSVDRATRALAEAAAGRLRPTVGRTFPLELASSAHAAMEAREVLGKTLLVL
ncbi:MAG: zinc-binding dehydrogenase, partial [Umezawaea sp.]